MYRHLFGTVVVLVFSVTLMSQSATNISDINPGYSSSYPWNFLTLGNNCYFMATTASNEQKLFKTNGTLSSTTLLKDFNGNDNTPVERMIVGDNSFFLVVDDVTFGEEPWISDGTTNGTIMLKDIAPGKSSSVTFYNENDLIYSNGKYYFITSNSKNIGTTPWVSDGTASSSAPCR